MPSAAVRWSPLAALILTQIGYPLTAGPTRAALVIGTVVLGFTWSVGHAAGTRGARVAGALVAVAAGGLIVEAFGLATGFPFGSYVYGASLGPRLLGVPLVIPLAWAWMAWPAWLVAVHIVRSSHRGGTTVARVGVAGLALAAWDLFLDPQMVDEGYWTWRDPSPTLPGVDGVPVGNYVGWLAVALALMAVFARTAGPRASTVDSAADVPMLVLYLWTYASSVLAHAVFLGLPGSAWWGAAGMGLVAVPLALTLRIRARAAARAAALAPAR